MDDDVATRVTLHDLASRGPSAPNQTDGWTNTGPSHNIYRASIALRDKNFEYLCMRDQMSLKMVPFDRRRNFLFFVPTEVHALDGSPVEVEVIWLTKIV